MEGEAVPSREKMQSMDRMRDDPSHDFIFTMHAHLRTAQHSFALQRALSADA